MDSVEQNPPEITRKTGFTLAGTRLHVYSQDLWESSRCWPNIEDSVQRAIRTKLLYDFLHVELHVFILSRGEVSIFLTFQSELICSAKLHLQGEKRVKLQKPCRDVCAAICMKTLSKVT